MIQKQRVLIITLAVCFAAMLAAYFIIVRPLTSEPDETDEPPSTVAGEGIVYDGMYTMYPSVDEANVKSIEVHNENGSYKFSYDNDTGEFALDGHKGISYDKQKLTELIVGAGQALAINKITDSPTEEQLVEYGFKGEDAAGSYYILTTKNGAEYRVNYGKKLITGGAYYARYEGRDTVYIVSAEIENTILAPVEAMITPLLTGGVDVKSSMYINNFTIRHYGEDFLVCRNRTKDELALINSSAMAEAITLFPTEGYVMSMDYSTTLQTLATFVGDSVVAIEITDENLEKYGLKDKPYEISYEYDGFKFELTASEPVDGYYYVASSMFNIIAKVNEASLEFLKWDYLKWISPQFMSMPILTVDKVGVVCDGVDEVFDLTHYPNDDVNMTVIGKNCGQITDIESFRSFYTRMLGAKVMGYAPEDIDPDNYECLLKLTVTSLPTSKDTVIVNEYAFYRYSGGRCLITVNGEGLFYVFDDTVLELIDNVKAIINREPVSSPLL